MQNTGKNSVDLVLVHPPLVYNGSDYPIFPVPWGYNSIGSSCFNGGYLSGPPASSVPLGFETIKGFLEGNAGLKVKILNLDAVDKRIPGKIFTGSSGRHFKSGAEIFELEQALFQQKVNLLLGKENADLFAVDMYWLNFSHSAAQIIKLIKTMHPHSYTVTGGLTATYFAEEVMRNLPFLDFLIAGDGAVPLLELIQQLKGARQFQKVPNLLYRHNRRVYRGVKRDLNDFPLVQKYGYSSFGIILSRGCPLRCATCGGPSYAGDTRVYPQDYILKKIFKSAASQRGRVPLLHDPILTLGRRRWEELLREIKASGKNISLSIEFFRPHLKSDLARVAKYAPGSQINISPETLDEEARYLHKKAGFSNQELFMNMDFVNGCHDLGMSVWFMAGLGGEREKGVETVISFIENYYKKVRDLRNFSLQYNEMAFIDPGSPAFTYPQRYGYRIRFKRFSKYLLAFGAPIFKYHINYTTRHFSYSGLYKLFLEIRQRMNKIYYERGIIDRDFYGRVSVYNGLLKKYSFLFDRGYVSGDPRKRSGAFARTGKVFLADLAEDNRRWAGG